ncbi:DinB family protein [Ulvibacter antarcticus]|uniref:Putative damage-inducible protein DinB n=1 Tax=Ulvibacter antarcticus TaxID=442714 RepID=A0A3L9Z6L0_9FLAO|nr:DinB family protein [Ulvibacter antarcticus]RMA65915.1 putative damage-inducible protein DinB [Ulvibacter antarcticus]
MKNAILIFSLFISSVTIGQQLTVKSAFLEKWGNSRNYLLEVAEAMPEESFDFKPTERQMSFKEQLIHIKGNMDWLSTSYFTDNEFEKGVSEIPVTKAETIEVLTNAFDAVSEIISITSEAELNEIVDFFSGPKSKLQILSLLQDHVTHHRGQLIVYLNLNGINPPNYVGW